MTNPNAPAGRLTTTILVAVSLAVSLFVATRVMAAPASSDTAQLSEQYSSWAGGKSNAEALVTGLRNGSSITLVTHSSNGVSAVAGFTPKARLADSEVAGALSSARRSLARVGIRQPTADQIQSALVGGEVTLPNGKTRMLKGSVALRDTEPSGTQVVTR
jgi:hypothetical protein